MSRGQRFISGIGVAVIAVILPFLFLTFISKQHTAGEALKDHPHGTIIEWGNISCCGGSYEGVYVKTGMTIAEGAIGGIILPLCLLILTIYLLTALRKT